MTKSVFFLKEKTMEGKKEEGTTKERNMKLTGYHAIPKPTAARQHFSYVDFSAMKVEIHPGKHLVKSTMVRSFI